MKISGIYKIESISHPERIYIGSAVWTEKRWDLHKRELRYGKHHSSLLQQHFFIYGMEDLIFSIIELCPPELLIQREQYYLDALNPCFNICMLAGSTLGYKHTEETKQKMSKPRSEEGKQHMVANRKGFKKGVIPWNKGIKMPESVCQQMSTSRIGNQNAKGAKLSKETRDRMSKAKIGNKSRQGIPHSQEIKDKISASGKEAWKLRKLKQNKDAK